MSNKYSRHQSIISRQSDEGIGEDHWFKQFQKSLQKDAVQPKSIDSSLFDQINSIMNGKSKYPSVEAAVQDMKERSGLTAYLDEISKISTKENVAKKIAADTNKVIDKKIDMVPVVIKKFPGVKSTLENYIKDTKGNLPVPAIIEKIRSIHQNDVSDAKDWEDDKLINLVSELNLSAKTNNPSNFQDYSNLGTRDSDSTSDIDPSNTDAFHGLNPAKF
jgi:hypothetical protein